MTCEKPSGPRALATKIEERLGELEDMKADCASRRDRSPINKEIHRLSELLRWCETRAGY